jgi:hypothetical protein
MTYSSRIEIIASKTIEYMRRRLSAEQTPSIDVRFNAFEDIDKMIAHMRSRLKPSLITKEQEAGPCVGFC